MPVHSFELLLHDLQASIVLTGFPVAQVVKNLPANAGELGLIPETKSREDPLETV